MLLPVIKHWNYRLIELEETLRYYLAQLWPQTCVWKEKWGGGVHEPALVFQIPHGNSIFEDNIVSLIDLRKHEFPLLLAGVINMWINQLFLETALGEAKAFKNQMPVAVMSSTISHWPRAERLKQLIPAELCCQCKMHTRLQQLRRKMWGV